jgi:hypothetical protein
MTLQSKRHARRLLLVAMLPLVGCAAWRPASPHPQLANATYSQRIRVTLSNEMYMFFDSARVAHDTLYGYRRGLAREAVDSSVRLDVREVREVEMYGYSRKLTIKNTLLVAGIAFVAVSLVQLVQAITSWDVRE